MSLRFGPNRDPATEIFLRNISANILDLSGYAAGETSPKFLVPPA